MKAKQKKFKIVKILITIIVALGLLCGIGWFVNHETAKQETPQTGNEEVDIALEDETPTQAEAEVDPNEGYLVVQEWGLRFKVPESLTDVRYAIHDNDLAFFARPAGSDVQYRPDYDEFKSGYYTHAMGMLYRSTDSTKLVIETLREGTKIGDYYYYTAWAFSGLATGVGACFSTYGDDKSNCELTGSVFTSINMGEKALLNTIELAQ